MANPIRLSKTVPKVFSSSKVVPVARQKQKHDPQGQPKHHLKKELAFKKRDLLATPSQRSSPKDGAGKTFRKKGAGTQDRGQGNLINIHI